MSSHSSNIFEEFKSGQRPLFIAKKKGMQLAEASWLDIGVQKWEGGVRMMFWTNASSAEAFILKSGATCGFEPYLIVPEELWSFVTRIWGPRVEHEFPYFLSED